MAEKAARKKPVRKAPVQKDYPTKLAWLEAMMAYEQSVEAQAAEHKIARLDKRIEAHEIALTDLSLKVSHLRAERDKLVNGTAEWTEQDHLAAEGKA